MRVRAELKSGGEEDDATKITVNDFILKGAVVAALREPKVNAAFDGDAIIQYGDINLAVAVAIDEGLVTPVIRGAQNKSLREISAAVKDLAHRARNKRMKPEEFQGGTLTVSNLGSYGIDYFSAIINPPQAIILSIGAIVKKPVVNEADEIVPGYRMKIGMSCDHRVVDGAIGANYLKALRQLLENPVAAPALTHPRPTPPAIVKCWRCSRTLRAIGLCHGWAVHSVLDLRRSSCFR